jgi:hypothetical protein
LGQKKVNISFAFFYAVNSQGSERSVLGKENPLHQLKIK